MEKQDYYTLKEIILGLRQEYLIHQEKLQELKQLCEMNPKKVADFNFYTYKGEYEKGASLFCDYIPKPNFLRRAITAYCEKTNLIIYGSNIATLVNDNNRYYFLRHKYPVHIKGDKHSNLEFYDIASEIINSEFANNIGLRHFEMHESDIVASVNIGSEGLDLFIRNSYDNIPTSILEYLVADDTLSFCAYDNQQLNSQYLKMALDVAIPSERLSEYHKGIIDYSENTKKPLILEPFEACSDNEFNIQDEKTQYVLSRVKK